MGLRIWTLACQFQAMASTYDVYLLLSIPALTTHLLWQYWVCDAKKDPSFQLLSRIPKKLWKHPVASLIFFYFSISQFDFFSILVLNTVCGSLYTLYHYNLIQKNSLDDLEEKEEETEKGKKDFSSFPIPTFIYLFAISLTGPTLFPYVRNYVLRYL